MSTIIFVTLNDKIKGGIPMKKVIKLVISVAIFIIAMGNSSLIYAETDTEAYYISYYGAELTKEQYENMLTVYDKDTIFYMSPDLIDELKDEELHVYMEKELEDERLNPPSVATAYEVGGAMRSSDNWNAYWETEYKILTMRISGAASVKTVTLTTKWKKLTQSRYYDVMGFRTKAKDVVFKMSDAQTLVATQKADGLIVGNYNINSSGVKICSEGIGLSVLLDKNAKKSLEFSMTVKFGSGADPFHVYGTYQHAQKEVTESQSKKYSINSSGYGGVFDFDSSVAGKYDKTEGLYVHWSLNDYN